MAIIQNFRTIEEATEFVGVIAEYIEYDLSTDKVTPDIAWWIQENLVGRVSVVIEYQFDKQYLVLLFSETEDATGFKLRWT